ncbi:DUF7260 family protein [Haloarcula pellucida]|uniref:DUF7260 domain-containing protein n=1 Tax=Haloarcula pellucida TaxID=1427151 RepID=A0A830GJQ2_9EURY|nr:hypothetical protein [Halomicroarcula pellucida]MBX0347438.1 hypothetical protein [Halomicroarcula pellucida]GGN88682.1 hypothetical protein GCM10009030_08630 [Halomicroarcula pellucida]
MIDTNVPATHYLQSFRQYVLSPVTTALEVVEREEAEVEAEAEAFDAFADAVEDIPTAGPQAWQPVSFHTPRQECKQLERVCDAYRETVMSVPHYDEVYGESLVENVMLELGEEMAEGLRTKQGGFTAPYKQALVRTARDTASERRRFFDTLADEADSLSDAKQSLSDLVVELDGMSVPQWYESTFTETLDGVVATRQAHLDRQESLPGENRTSLCSLLYDDEPWTFPVLTAATRVRDIIGTSDG